MAATLNYLIDIDPDTGAYVSGWPRIQKSIICILTTQLGTRLMRLGWGSNFLDIQDKPLNAEVLTLGIYRAAYFINKYEPEFRVTSINIGGTPQAGYIQIDVTGVDLVLQQSRQMTTLI